MLGRAGAPGIEGRLEARLGIRKLHVGFDEVRFFILSSIGQRICRSRFGDGMEVFTAGGGHLCIFITIFRFAHGDVITISPVAEMRGLGSRIIRC